MSTMTNGNDLNYSTRAEVLRAFVHRFTGDHKPDWARKPRPDGTAYPLQFKDDADWLANTFFAINRDGSLSAKQHFCSSSPTWPNNPELRANKLTVETTVE